MSLSEIARGDQKLGTGRNGSKINTARYRTASLLKICAASAKSTEACVSRTEEWTVYFITNLLEKRLLGLEKTAVWKKTRILFRLYNDMRPE